MAYRNPNVARIQTQSTTIFEYAGQSAIWRDYVSAVTASTGLSMRGQGTTVYYRESTITALFALLPPNREQQTPAGMIAATEFQVTTRERLARMDQLLWRGEVYRVESDPSPAPLAGFWVSNVVRGNSA